MKDATVAASVPVLEAQAISKSFGGFPAVRDVSLHIPAGGIYGLLGPNGAGKSTTLRMLLGIIPPDIGAVRVWGHPHDEPTRHRIGYLPEERGLYPMMKARDAIGFIGALRGVGWSEASRRGAAMMEEVGLSRVIDERVRKMSKGMAQMVQLIGSLIHQPDLIVLDEPFSGLDPVNQERLERLVQRERERGATVLFSTHVMQHAERLCDRLAIIAHGRVQFEGGVDAARSQLPLQLHYTPRDMPSAIAAEGAAPAFLPDGAQWTGTAWRAVVPDSDADAVVARIAASGQGIASLTLTRPSLHDAFMHIVARAGADTRDPSARAVQEIAA